MYSCVETCVMSCSQQGRIISAMKSLKASISSASTQFTLSPTVHVMPYFRISLLNKGKSRRVILISIFILVLAEYKIGAELNISYDVNVKFQTLALHHSGFFKFITFHFFSTFNSSCYCLIIQCIEIPDNGATARTSSASKTLLSKHKQRDPSHTHKGTSIFFFY